MKKRLTVIVVAFIMLFAVLGTLQAVTINKNLTDDYVLTAVIKQGSQGELVKAVQTKLKRWGYYQGPVDGIYGSKTKAAVIYFQKKNGLSADGIVGKKTLAALGINESKYNNGSGSGSSSQGGVGKYSSQDVALLARLIYGEARGESYTGQVAVAAVVLNRIKSSSFPNTVSGVIYQPYAFTAVADGQINYTPDSTAYSAAKDAINGWDPTGGAIYYYNPKTATSAWIYSRKVTTTIGNHVFAV